MEARLVKCVNFIIVEDFFPILAGKLNVPQDTLVAIWTEFSGTGMSKGTYITESGGKSYDKTQVDMKPKVDTASIVYSEAQLKKMTLKDLKPICGALKLPTSGVKATIIANILSKQGKVTPAASPEVVDDPKADPKPPKQKKLDLEKFRKPTVEIEKNSSGHWVHKETGIVFTEDEELVDGIRCRIAIGYEDEDGDVVDLNEDKLDQCHQYGFRAREPDNIVI